MNTNACNHCWVLKLIPAGVGRLQECQASWLWTRSRVMSVTSHGRSWGPLLSWRPRGGSPSCNGSGCTWRLVGHAPRRFSGGCSIRECDGACPGDRKTRVSAPSKTCKLEEVQLLHRQLRATPLTQMRQQLQPPVSAVGADDVALDPWQASAEAICWYCMFCLGSITMNRILTCIHRDICSYHSSLNTARIQNVRAPAGAVVCETRDLEIRNWLPKLACSWDALPKKCVRKLGRRRWKEVGYQT